MHQHDIFLNGEADAWFARNQHVLTPEHLFEHDLVLRLVERVDLDAASHVLEVGAANGFRLAAIRDRYGSSAVAVDPSARALADGRKRFPEIRHVRGLAHELSEFPDQFFNLVIVNFVLHWVDRAMLLKTAAEMDRVLKDGGHLVVSDFYPDRPQRVAYHHLPGADTWTYKQNYAQLWLATNTYAEVAALTFHHGTHAVSEDIAPAHRAKVYLLRKSLRDLYPAVALPH